MPSSPSDPKSASKDTVEQSLKLLRELARIKDVAQKGIPVTDIPSALVTNIPSTPATDAAPASAAGPPSAFATDAPSVPAAILPTTPATDIPARDQRTAYSGASSTTPASHRPAGSMSLWLVALSFSCVALVAGLITTFLYRTPKYGVHIEPPRTVRAAPSAPVASSPPAASPAPAEKPAEQAITQGTSDLQPVQKAMADCDKEAAQNPDKLYLLIIPVAPITALAQATRPESETYPTFYLMTSKATLSGLENASYSIDSRPFIFSIEDPTSGEGKSWNLVSGLKKIVHNGPERFQNFRVGFDPTGRGFGVVWSSSYARQPGVCYWINTRFRVTAYENRH